MSRWAISTRTELIVAPEPLIDSLAVGTSPTSSETRSQSPPAILRKGRISSSTSSIPSSVSCGPSGATWITSMISGIFSRSPRSSQLARRSTMYSVPSWPWRGCMQSSDTSRSE